MTNSLLTKSTTALKEGRNAEARALLAQLLQQDPRNEQAWLWLSGAVDTDEQRRHCLERVLEINPNNKIAQRGMARFAPGAGGPLATPPPTAVSPAAQTKQGQWMIGAGVALLAVVCIALAALAGASVASRPPTTGPMHDGPYVIVYGRSGDKHTEQMTKGLDKHGVPYVMKNIDSRIVQNTELIPRMREAGI